MTVVGLTRQHADQHQLVAEAAARDEVPEDSTLGLEFTNNDQEVTPMPLAIIPAPDWQGAVVRFAEKVLATYVQALIVALLAARFFESVGLSVLQSCAIAALPALFTVIANRITGASIPAEWPYLVALAVRTVQTGVAGAIGYIAGIPLFHLDASIGKATWAAASLAVLAFLKGEAARFVGERGTPALVSARFDVQPGPFGEAV